MSNLHRSQAILGRHTIAQLQRLALATGVSVSGPKSHLIARLDGVISSCNSSHTFASTSSPEAWTPPSTDLAATRCRHLRVLSIDMGIRNFAYAFLVGTRQENSGVITTSTRTPPVLEGWNRAVISPPRPCGDDGHYSSDLSLSPGTPRAAFTTAAAAAATGTSSPKETFDPLLYAGYAYDLVTTLLRRFKPSHVLIERQRFRSGGASAVQEWTIRVGMFEAMIHAVLETLRRRDEEGTSWTWRGRTVPVDPGKVARYWINNNYCCKAADGKTTVGSEGASRKSKSQEYIKGKAAKMAIVRSWLTGQADPARVRLPPSGDRDHGEVAAMVDNYLRVGSGGRGGRGGRRRRKDLGDSALSPHTKLDDLADCLLQGVAWLEWQRTREKIQTAGWETVIEEMVSKQ